jgi:hypothetical protein
MSKSKEKKILKQQARTEKLEREIREGKSIRLVYEERKEKISLPNRLNTSKTAEEEINTRQDDVEKATAVYRQMLPCLLKKLASIKDPRKVGRIKHKMIVLMAYGIILFVFQTGSRREANRTLSRPIFFKNLKAMFPELESLPHADTLARLLETIEVSKIQDCMIELIKDLIRKKKFQSYLIRKYFLIAVDGTQKLYRNYQLDEKCLQRTVGKEDSKTTQFYVYVLESVLILDNGITFPLISMLLENKDYVKGVTKQDCEIKAFKRFAEKLKKIFPRMKIALTIDGLYACGPIVKICRKNCWDFMIVLKEDKLSDVWREATGLMRFDPENSLEMMWGEREQVYTWANDIEYEYIDDKNKHRTEFLNVVICNETWKENQSRTTGKIVENNTRYAWISSIKLNAKNVFYRCSKLGRYRWLIENNILTEKHQGYDYEHCYSYTWNALEGFHYLMKIARFLNVLALNSTLLIEKVRQLGIRGFIKNLKLACSGCVLDLKKIEAIVKQEHYWSLVS